VFVLTFLALAAVVMCIYAGILYVLSLGKEEQASKAKGLLIRVLIGTVVILLSLALVRFVIIIDPTFAAGGFSR
ncbi:MAG: hypothetical protein Q7R41_06940, partial [Phycisphaerales bacterium]|nr:hypothetical protein [Phycisphaerales bacterium]